ncbi:hypothetical protein N7540_004277 [Penicillium herquei]|nr:hypothetical protein N7540_004277 [Penicillium herquei]
MAPRMHRGPLSAVGRLLDDYEHMVSNVPMPNTRMYSPSFDFRETEDSYLLEGELPGVEQSDLDIEFEDPHRLNIKGHSEHAASSNEGSWWVSERSIGELRRTFNFPTAVDEEKAHAELKNGVLYLTVPKSSSARNTRKITVHT